MNALSCRGDCLGSVLKTYLRSAAVGGVESAAAERDGTQFVIVALLGRPCRNSQVSAGCRKVALVEHENHCGDASCLTYERDEAITVNSGVRCYFDQQIQSAADGAEQRRRPHRPVDLPVAERNLREAIDGLVVDSGSSGHRGGDAISQIGY